jgi:hypothetical protein
VDERLIRTVDLKNGLRLEIIDSSRYVAGDRWQVILTTRIKIPVNKLSDGDDPQAAINMDDIMSSLGESVQFEQKRERNFIDANQKDEILNNLIESFSASSLDYVSNPDFPKRCILRQYRDYLKRKSWYPDGQNE